MKLKQILILSLTIIILTGCSDKKDTQKRTKINGRSLSALVEEALWGSDEANYELSGLVSPGTPPPGQFNKLKIDSVFLNNSKFFSVLIEYPNPLFNTLAVYDEKLNLYLLDNSLNGNITVHWDALSGKKYLIAYENFVSKDILKLGRISLYTFRDSLLQLVYRGFSKLDKAGKIYTQTIESISDESISTSIKSSVKSDINNKADIFYYDKEKHRYISNANIFNTFILNEIKNAKWLIEKPELTVETAGVTNPVNKTGTNKESESSDVNFEGFQIEPGLGWKVLKNISVSENLESKLTGTKILSEKLGAQITILKLPAGTTAEKYVKYKFGKPTKGDYKVRSTKLLKTGKNYIQYTEHSCGNKTYILILQAPKNTFNKYKNIYDEIQTSFFIEC